MIGMSKKKAMLTTAAALLTLTTVLAGCGGGNSGNSSSPSGTSSSSGASGSTEAPSNGEAPATPVADIFELGSEPLNLKFYAHYDWFSMAPWGQDIASKWIKDNKKVNIEYIPSGNNAQQKLNTMLAGKDLPDLIWFNRGAAEFEMMRKNDMLAPFDEYIDKYPNMKKWVPEELRNMLRSEDGKLYQFPNWYTNKPVGNAGWIINKKIYKELGSPKLETTEDLYSYAKLVKEKYPRVTPIESDLAIDGQLLDVLYSAFEENALNRWVGDRARPKDGVMTSIFNDPTYRESMKFAAKLYREKLMTQDAFSQTRDQVKEKILNGEVAVYASINATEFAREGQAVLSAQDPEAGYEMIWPIAKPGLDRNKIFPGTYTYLGWNVITITKNTPDPEKAFAFLDWFTGPEAQSVLMWGPPGEFWDEFKDVDGVPTPVFNENYVKKQKELVDLQAITTWYTWNGNAVFTDKTKGDYESTLPEQDRNWETSQQYNIAWRTQGEATEFVNLEPAKDSEDGVKQTAVEDIWDKSRAEALMNTKSDADVDRILDKAHEDAMKVGYQAVLDFKTKKWHENRKAMGRE